MGDPSLASGGQLRGRWREGMEGLTASGAERANAKDATAADSRELGWAKLVPACASGWGLRICIAADRPRTAWAALEAWEIGPMPPACTRYVGVLNPGTACHRRAAYAQTEYFTHCSSGGPALLACLAS